MPSYKEAREEAAKLVSVINTAAREAVKPYTIDGDRSGEAAAKEHARDLAAELDRKGFNSHV